MEQINIGFSEYEESVKVEFGNMTNRIAMLEAVNSALRKENIELKKKIGGEQDDNKS